MKGIFFLNGEILLMLFKQIMIPFFLLCSTRWKTVNQMIYGTYKNYFEYDCNALNKKKINKLFLKKDLLGSGENTNMRTQYRNKLNVCMIFDKLCNT